VLERNAAELALLEAIDGGHPVTAMHADVIMAAESEEGMLPALERALASGRPAVVDVIQDRNEGLPADLLPPIAR
jgi:thiamine pyrophosphate-dependent acetolactate synthase large subunit-like protein